MITQGRKGVNSELAPAQLRKQQLGLLSPRLIPEGHTYCMSPPTSLPWGGFYRCDGQETKPGGSRQEADRLKTMSLEQMVHSSLFFLFFWSCFLL